METIPENVSEEQTFTKTAIHVKNPKRVAQGKRLAEQSRLAKQKRKQDQQNQQDQLEPEESNFEFSFPISTLLGTGACLFSTYIAYKQWTDSKPKETQETQETQKTQKETKEPKETKPNSKTVYNNLDKYSL